MLKFDVRVGPKHDMYLSCIDIFGVKLTGIINLVQSSWVGLDHTYDRLFFLFVMLCLSSKDSFFFFVNKITEMEFYLHQK